MDEFDKKMKDYFNNVRPSKKYNEMIQHTMKMISDDEIERGNVIDFKQEKKKSKKSFIRKLQSVAAIIVFAGVGFTTYAGVTGKINFSLKNTGHEKINKNYSQIAVATDEKVENEYFVLSLESMAADPAYLIFEYDLKFKQEAMNEIGEIPYDEFEGYQIYFRW